MQISELKNDHQNFQDSLYTAKDGDDRLTVHAERVRSINKLNEKYSTMDIRWKSCCFYIDKGLLQFIFETVFALGVIIFCIIQMIRLPDCESQQLYSGILTFVIGILVPQPTLRENVPDS